MKFKARPAVDQTWDFGVVNVLQFDGEGGANLAADNKNLRYIIDGLNNILFLIVVSMSVFFQKARSLISGKSLQTLLLLIDPKLHLAYLL